jgi:chorismate mutase / prephenate dehydratase
MSEDLLDHWRAEVDALDREIIRLLVERVEAARKIGEAKRALGAPLQDPDREEAVLRRLKEQNGGRLGDRALEAVYRRIFEMCIEAQKEMRP